MINNLSNGIISGGLLDCHRQKLNQKYFIPTEDYAFRFYEEKGLICSVDKDEAKRLLKYDVDSGGILIRYPNAPEVFTIRLDKPSIDNLTKKERKYLRPEGSTNALYIPNGVSLENLNEIVITEGELKALCATILGLPTIGLSGIYNWRGIKQKVDINEQQRLFGGDNVKPTDADALIEDILNVNWNGKSIFMIYDSDISNKHKGWPAFGNLAEQLYNLGVKDVRIFTLPKFTNAGNAKVGLDDFFSNALKEGVPIPNAVKNLRDKILSTPIWIPKKDGARKFAETIASLKNPSREEKINAVASIYLSEGKNSASSFAGTFGVGKAALLGEAKAQLSHINNRQNYVAEYKEDFSTLGEHVLSIVRSCKSDCPPVPPEIMRSWIFDKVKKTFSTLGKFYKSKGLDKSIYYFKNDTCTLYNMHSIEFQSFFIVKTGLSIKVENGKDCYDRLTSYVFEEGIKVDVRKVSHFDEKTCTMYMNLNSGKLLKMDGEKVETVDNGTDNALFLSDAMFEPWEYVEDISLDDKALFNKLFSSLNFSSDQGLNHDQFVIVLLSWFVGSFFRCLLPTKPILLIKGEKGSAKTSVLRFFLKTVFGLKSEVDVINPEKVEQFEILITNKPLVCIDNLDGNVKKILDMLAAAATGSCTTKRVLYTTNDYASFENQAWISIASRTPKLQRDDITERLLIIPVEPLKEKIPEQSLLRKLSQKRNELISILVKMINSLVLEIKENGISESGENFRMADYAAFLRAYLRQAKGIDNGDKLANEILAGLSSIQGNFLIEEDYICDLICECIADGQISEHVPYKLLELLRIFSNFDDSRLFIRTPKALSRMLKERGKALKEQRGVYIDFGNTGGATTVYFKKLPNFGQDNGASAN
jgi:hypothetical protein